MLNRYAFGGFIATALLLGAAATPVAAQSGGVTASEAIQNSRNMYGPPPPRRKCDKQSPSGEIVVCAEDEQDDTQFRVKSTRELDPKSREALNDGVPRAPDVGGEGIFKGKSTIGGLCVVGGCPPPPAYMFDLSDLPEAPPGSDADLIAKGEKPGG